MSELKTVAEPQYYKTHLAMLEKNAEMRKDCTVMLKMIRQQDKQIDSLQKTIKNKPISTVDDKCKRALEEIAQIDVSGRNAWKAGAEMKEIAQKALKGADE